MKKISNRNKATIIIVNYNNAVYLTKSINSALSQNYKNKEVIVVDNNSTDNSISILNNFKKKITIIKNKKRTLHGSFNQINSYFQGYKYSKGDYIFFLDSDDYFHKNKINLIIKKFKRDKETKLIFDLPILKFKNKLKKNKFIQKSFIFASWPRFTPQSCISVKKDYAFELFKKLKINKFSMIWFDFRIAAYHFLKYKQITIMHKYLTYYRQSDNSASKEFKTFNKKWWARRKQAHEFVNFFKKKLNIKKKFNLEQIVTEFVNFIQ